MDYAEELAEKSKKMTHPMLPVQGAFLNIEVKDVMCPVKVSF